MQLTLNNMKEAEFARNIFAITPDHGTSIKDMLKPEYWAHVAGKLSPTSRIEVVSEDSTWFAELFVVSVGRNWAQVSLMRFVELAESAKPASPEAEYRVEWKGQKQLHCVIRKADNAIIRNGFQKATDASKWLTDYEAQTSV